MSAAARLCAALAVLLLPRPPREDPATSATRYPAIADAVRAVLDVAPGAVVAPAGALVVVGFGELHQINDTAGIPSSLRRFTADVLPLIAPRTSDLVVETWVTDGHCGQSEAAVVADVEQTTQRPKATESEIVTLLRRARELGVRPHILRVSCGDYQALSPRAGGVDYQRMLALTRRQLEATITRALAGRPAADAGKLVAVYGGALHNDLHPDRLLASFSYGPSLFHATGGRYREIDLYVPEYLDRNAAVRAERWYPEWKRHDDRPGQPVVLRRSADSFVIVFARGGGAGGAAAAVQR